MRRAFGIICLIALSAIAGLPLGGTAAAQQHGVEAPDWQAQPIRLMMVEQAGCIYCARWDAEIAPGFAKSAEGRLAPLMRVDIDGPWPDGIVLDSRPVITPTFILLDRGVELDRIEGYVGAKYFYPVLAERMQQAGLGS